MPRLTNVLPIICRPPVLLLSVLLLWLPAGATLEKTTTTRRFIRLRVTAPQ